MTFNSIAQNYSPTSITNQCNEVLSKAAECSKLFNRPQSSSACNSLRANLGSIDADYRDVINAGIDAVVQSTSALKLLAGNPADTFYANFNLLRNTLIGATNLTYIALAESRPVRTEHFKGILKGDNDSWIRFEKRVKKFEELAVFGKLTEDSELIIADRTTFLGSQTKASNEQIFTYAAPLVMKFKAKQYRNILDRKEMQAAERLPKNYLETLQTAWHVSSGHSHTYPWPKVRDLQAQEPQLVWHGLVFSETALELFTMFNEISEPRWDVEMAKLGRVDDAQV